MTAIPRQAAEASTLRTVLVVTVGLALFVTASAGLGMVIWRDPSAGTSTGAAGRALPADPGAAAGQLEESSRRAAIGNVTMVLPGPPYSLYPDPLIDAGFGAGSPKRLFLPLHHDQSRAAQLRAEGWQTVAALTAQENGEALRCTHWLDGDEPHAY